MRLGVASSRRAAAKLPPIPPRRAPVLDESDYAGRLVQIVARWRAALQPLLDALPSLLTHRDIKPANMRHDDDPGRRARTAMDQARAEVAATTSTTALETMVGSFGHRVAAHGRAELVDQVRTVLGREPVLPDTRVAGQISAFVHENVTRVTKLERATLDHVETVVTGAIARGLGPDEVGAEVAKRFGIAERHARLIAHDQINKLDAAVTRGRHQDMGLRGYIWRHTSQPHPRLYHVARDGQRFEYSKPPSDGHPGTAVACKCYEQIDYSELAGGGAPWLLGLGAITGEVAGDPDAEPDEPVWTAPAELDDLPVYAPAAPRGHVQQQPLPVLAPPGYYTVEDWPGITTYVSHRTGNRYTESDVRAGHLDPPEPVPAAGQRPGVLRRIGAAVKRALRLDGELIAPRGFDPGGRVMLEGVPPRELADPAVACVVPVRALAWRCVAASDGGDHSGPVSDDRRERIREAWDAGIDLPPLRAFLLPDGRVLINDGRHRLLTALEDGRDVLMLFSAGAAADGVGAVPVSPA